MSRYNYLRLTILWCMPLLRYLPFRRRTIVRNGAPYLTRIYLTPSTGRLGAWWRDRYSGHFLHFFHCSDPDSLHNHPWCSARTTILRGGYVETKRPYHTTATIHVVRWPGDEAIIFGSDFHRVELLNPDAGCWSYFRAGVRHGFGWGFTDGRKGVSDNA